MQNNEEEAALPKSEADAVDEEPEAVNTDDNTELPNKEEDAATEASVPKSESDEAGAEPVAENNAEGKEAAGTETEEEPLTIVLVGMAGVGKSTAINRMLTSIDSDRDTVKNLI